ncbi:DNA alkylation repair protein [Terasakiella pusilla]|uniref:DNA alkylation repair protein n=1 Tax=Terasakiella pusilla TaxID=64973 RepID=UPI003AA95F5B
MTRVGERKRVSDITPERLAQLNRGEAEATVLTECLAVDFAHLMWTVLPDIGSESLERMKAAATQGITRRMALAADLILARYGREKQAELTSHPSDTVRGWACYVLAAVPDLSLQARLDLMRTLADDAHFGVREWSWLSLRPHLAAELETSIDLLSAWTHDPSERIRRFVCEALRPRGVWCAHLKTFKTTPELCLPVLDPLKADPAIYVQDSVANWLNDASKDQPDWVANLCQRWMRETTSAETARICKRALRTIHKVGC